MTLVANVNLHQVILPIIITDTTEYVRPIGSGFVIAANGRQAIMVTAAHVITEIKHEDQPYDTQHPTCRYLFEDVTSLTRLERTIPRVLYFDGTAAFPATLETAIEMPKADLCVCSIRFSEEVPREVKFIHRLPIDTTPVAPGDAIRAVGYAEMTNDLVSRAETEGLFSFRAQLRKPAGRVVGAFANGGGPRSQKHACFQIDVPLDPGMSGGPILSETHGVHYARGIISSDETGYVDGQLKATGAAAFASMLWPIMMMPAKVPSPDGSIGEDTILDLQQRGVIWDVGAPENHIHCVRGRHRQILECHRE